MFARVEKRKKKKKKKTSLDALIDSGSDLLNWHADREPQVLLDVDIFEPSKVVQLIWDSFVC